MAVEFISGRDHNEKVIARVASVRKSLWIGTADMKDLLVKAGSSTEPFLAVLAKLLKRGSLNVAKELMGHSDISVTAKIYTHMVDEVFEQNRKRLEEYANQKEQKAVNE